MKPDHAVNLKKKVKSQSFLRAYEGGYLKIPQSGFFLFFFRSRKKKTISTKPSMQSFLPLTKKHFHYFYVHIVTLIFLKRDPENQQSQKFQL